MAFGHERDACARSPFWAIAGLGMSVVGLLVAYRLWRRHGPPAERRLDQSG